MPASGLDFTDMECFFVSIHMVKNIVMTAGAFHSKMAALWFPPLGGGSHAGISIDSETRWKKKIKNLLGEAH